MSLVACKLSKAGLGNQLFPLMKAYTFAHLNHLPVIVTGYHRIKTGPYLRGEKSKRSYNGYFTFQKNIIEAQIEKWKLFHFKKEQKVNEPEVKVFDSDDVNKLYFFSKIPHWNNYFEQLKENRYLVVQLFWELISPGILEELAQNKTPDIGVHIRMGDYRKLKEGETFSQVGSVRTPEKYFIDAILKIRQIHKTELPVSVFTDGYKDEFKELFSLNDITIVEGNRDIIDLLLLSRSKIIVCSATSTFSYWAGFLSASPIILHPDHIHSRIRNEAELFEGTVEEYIKQLQ